MIRTLCAAATLLVAVNVQAQEYGTIKGQFVLDGEVPKPEILVTKGDPKVKDAVCVKQDIVSRGLVVDPQTKGIKNVFVYLLKAPDNVHPDLQDPPEKPVKFDNASCRFEPHGLFVREGQGVQVTSSDPFPHNTHTFPIRNRAVNFLLQPNDQKGVVVPTEKPEFLPIQVKCDIHPWMSAYWLILDHPYAAVTNAKGEFTIEKLPVGDYEFRVWHEKAGYVERSWKVSVTSGEQELEPVAVPPSKFEE